jgi:hypothetical protein
VPRELQARDVPGGGLISREGVGHVPDVKDLAARQGPFDCLREAGMILLLAQSFGRLVVAQPARAEGESLGRGGEVRGPGRQAGGHVAGGEVVEQALLCFLADVVFAEGDEDARDGLGRIESELSGCWAADECRLPDHRVGRHGGFAEPRCEQEGAQRDAPAVGAVALPAGADLLHAVEAVPVVDRNAPVGQDDPFLEMHSSNCSGKGLEHGPRNIFVAAQNIGDRCLVVASIVFGSEIGGDDDFLKSPKSVPRRPRYYAMGISPSLIPTTIPSGVPVVSLSWDTGACRD